MAEAGRIEVSGTEAENMERGASIHTVVFIVGTLSFIASGNSFVAFFGTANMSLGAHATEIALESRPPGPENAEQGEVEANNRVFPRARPSKLMRIVRAVLSWFLTLCLLMAMGIHMNNRT